MQNLGEGTQALYGPHGLGTHGFFLVGGVDGLRVVDITGLGVVATDSSLTQL